jgi:hypothetical protein
MSDGACPECGAQPRDGRTCSDLLHDLLVRKYAGDGAEYGLVVACYTLQHPTRQSNKVLEWARFHLTVSVQHGLPLAEARRASRARFDQRRARPGTPASRVTVPAAGWRMTIAQLEAPPAVGDAARILLWARTILEDVDAQAVP